MTDHLLFEVMIGVSNTIIPPNPNSGVDEALIKRVRQVWF